MPETDPIRATTAMAALPVPVVPVDLAALAVACVRRRAAAADAGEILAALGLEN
jgi:hypothetical protein